MCTVHHLKCQAGCSTSWNQDFWDKYQSPQICRWYHPNGRKLRGTKEPLDESEREWKTGLQLNIETTKIMASGPITSWQIDGETVKTVTDFIFLGSKITVRGYCIHKLISCSLEENLWLNLDSLLKNRDITLPTKVLIVNQSYSFSSSHVWMWELDHKEGWVLRNWYFWTVVLEKTLEGPLNCKEIKPVHSKGNQSWIFIGRTDAEAAIFWPPNVKSQLIRKDADSGEDRRQKGMTENKMVGWHYWLNANLSKLLEMVKDRETWCVAVHGIAKNRTWLSDWATTSGNNRKIKWNS